MVKVHARRSAIAAVLLVAVGVFVWSGCSQDLMDPDIQYPTDSAITNPLDQSSLNKSVINVRGRAEVGATVEILVNDVQRGSAVASPAVPNDGLGGRFTVDDVDLGDEGVKTLRARISDLYGNTTPASASPTITVTLDQTAPPVEFESFVGAEWVDTLGYWGEGFWETGVPEIILQGRTDLTAAGARARYGINAHEADTYETLPPDTLRFWIMMTTPPLSAGHADTLIQYHLEAYDEAGNIGTMPVYVHWEVEGKEEELSHDDGDYTSYLDVVEGRPGQKIAVRFQAPTWANYVTKVSYYIANDQVDNPVNPDDPSTMPFTAWVWRVTVPDSLPGPPGNDGYTPFPEPYMYPEDEWVTITFPNAVNITDNAHFPDKKFFVGLEWEYRLNPYIYEDKDEPLSYKSFRWNWSEWEMRTLVNTMIRATVSDVESMGDDSREAVLTIR